MNVTMYFVEVKLCQSLLTFKCILLVQFDIFTQDFILN
jgi:hypothetical protein